MILALVATSSAATLTINDELDVLTADYYSPDPEFGMDEASSQVSVSSSAPTVFNQDFSQQGEVDLSFTWSAPAGYQLRIERPSGFDQATIGLRYEVGSTGISAGRTNGTQHTIALVGDMPISPSGYNAYFSGPTSNPAESYLQLWVDFNLAVGEVYTLESLTYTLKLDASYAGVFQNGISNSYISGYASTNSGNPGDPGQWVSLVAIPETSTSGLVALVFVFGIARRRR